MSIRDKLIDIATDPRYWFGFIMVCITIALAISAVYTQKGFRDHRCEIITPTNRFIVRWASAYEGGIRYQTIDYREGTIMGPCEVRELPSVEKP